MLCLGLHLQLIPINYAKNFLALGEPAPSTPPGYAWGHSTLTLTWGLISYFWMIKIASNLKTTGQILIQFNVVVYLSSSTSKMKSGHI